MTASERARFDRLLADTRYGLSQRDDSAGIRLNWPAGLTHRALQQAGERLTRAGLLAQADHFICLTPVVVAVLLRGGDSPTAAEVTEPAATPEFQLSLDPPLSLGPDEEPPPFAALPKGMGRATATVIAMIEPGDVLIAPFTSPSFNSMLPLIGAIAVQEGGVLSHTAIVAREFGIPAVVGVAGLLTDIRDGETVEIDAAAWAVRPGCDHPPSRSEATIPAMRRPGVGR